MQQVAEHLCVEAKRLKGSDADLFARTAFNRYYYASYLSARELLARLNSQWTSQSHKGIPDLMERSLTDLVRRQAKKLAGKGLLTAAQQSNLVSQVNQASSDIASVLRVAYAVRVVADYKPELLVIFDVPNFTLDSHSDAEARNWKARVDRAKGIILNVTKELGLV